MKCVSLHRWLFVWLCLFSAALFVSGLSPVQAEERSLRIVELRYSLAEPVLEILRPHLPAGVGASAVDNKLLLNMTETEWQAVQNVIGQLDKPPARLLVTVQWRRNQQQSTAVTEAEVQVDNQGASASVGGSWQTERGNEQQVQQIQSLAGQTAFIHTGMEIPQLTVHLTTRGRLITSQSYRESGHGFYVLPLLQANEVLVRINPRERVPVTGDDGVIRITALETEVRGPLGQWLPLASNYQAGNTTWQTQRNNWRVQIKIDKLP